MTLEPISDFIRCSARILSARLGTFTPLNRFLKPWPPVRKNVGLNGCFTQVIVEDAAVSDANGTTRFAIDEQSAKNAIASGGENGAARDGETIEVRLLSIDEYRKNTDASLPDVVMIDVEGAEIDVLRGMKNVLAQSRPVVLCEVHWLRDRMERCFDEIVRPLGYRITTYDGKPLPTENVRYHALLVPEEKAAA